MTALRILIAEDNQAVREGLRELLESQPDWRVVGEAVNGLEAVEKARDLQPEVVILDYSMPQLDGISAAVRIRQAAPQSELLVLTQHDAPYTVRRALDAGVRGYVVKSDADRDLLAAVEAVSQHRVFVSSSMAQNLSTERGPAPRT
ncbi:MAG TPA: response regulator transcription factor [Terriglobia bacterium]|nr:response regulator transcription factor [Terriglobia bacterium]